MFLLSKEQFISIIDKVTRRTHHSTESLSEVHLNYFSFLYYQKKYNIEKWREFLAQILYESNYLRSRVENHNYSTSRILQVFPKYFKTPKDASQYQHGIELFDRVYANRMGNGDEKSRDGSRYRGRGYIQLTGKNNYRRYGYVNDFLFLETMSGAWDSACKFWVVNKIDLCTTIKQSTRKINGGYNGLDKREKTYELIKTIV